MEEVIFAKCRLKNIEGKTKEKFCLFYQEKFYDIETFQIYEVYDVDKLDSNYRVNVAEIVDESKMKADSTKWLLSRKKDLVDMLNFQKYEGFEKGEGAVFKADAVLVMYCCNQVVLKGELYDLDFQEERYSGILLNNTVYDLKTRERVKTIDEDDIVLGELYLTEVFPVSSQFLTNEEQIVLLKLLIEISLVQETNLPKIITMR